MMIIILNFFTQIYLKRQRKRSAMENHSHIHPVHRVQSQTSDIIFMRFSIIVVKLNLKQNNSTSVTKIVHLKVRTLPKRSLALRLLPTFVGVLREKLRSRASFTKILTNYISEESLKNLVYDGNRI